MEKPFWHTIRENKYTFPAGHDLAALTEDLFSYLSSTDPELRDKIGYEIFANWIETEPYSPGLLRDYIKRLTANLQVGIGERDSDTVFLRAFSILVLAEIIHRDNQQPFLQSGEAINVFESVLAYLAAERDPRGYVAEKGWAHALAHTADALMVLARSPHLDASALLRIPYAASAKMQTAIDWIYVHGEDDRLANAIVSAFERDLLSVEQIQTWLVELTSDWKGAWTNEERSRAFFNVRNLMRAVHIRTMSSKKLPHQDEIQASLLETIRSFRPY